MNKRYERTVHVSEALDSVISQVRSLPVLTVGDAATDKLERRSKPRGDVARDLMNAALAGGLADEATADRLAGVLADKLTDVVGNHVEADKATRYGSDVQEID